MHHNSCYQKLNWDIADNLRNVLTALPWKNLEVTTGFSRSTVLKTITNHYKKWPAKSFLKSYGFFLQTIPTLLNLKLPHQLENQVLEQVGSHIKTVDDPIIRIQVMYGGCFLPIHIDPTRTASLIIPLANHQRSWTKFYKNQEQTSGQLLDPAKCVLFDQVEVLTPTLIDTKIPHAVWSDYCIKQNQPRLSLTVKWQNVKYLDLVEAIPL